MKYDRAELYIILLITIKYYYHKSDIISNKLNKCKEALT